MHEIPPARIAEIRRSLLEFFDGAARELPWRGETDPYRIWVSEVMLQQTRVETVIDYYRRWMERFPEIDALAGAEMDEVLQQWKGLGYYSRARNLREAAIVLRDRYDGRLPDSVAMLRELPGVGEYTAGAVASIAFGVPAPAVDGNVRRVLSRLFDLPDPKAAELRELAGSLVDPRRPGDFNQALMELGATVCVPRAPRCGGCPLQEDCRARAAGTVAERPLPRKRSAVREVVVGVAVVAVVADAADAAEVTELAEGRFRVLLRRRPDDGLLPGLWEFPGEEVVGVEEAAAEEAAAEEAAAGKAAGKAAGNAAEEAALRAFAACREGGSTGASPQDGVPLPEVRHVFSHLVARYRPVLFVVDAPDVDLPRERDGMRWLPVESLEDVPLSTAQQRIGKAMIEALARRATPPRTGRSPGTPSSAPRGVP